MLQNGVKELFESEKYAEYLKTMSKLHNYSTRNTLLIHLQMPGATKVAGYGKWLGMGRYVKKNEKGLRIYAPVRGNRDVSETEVIDRNTGLPVLGENGEPVTETLPSLAANMRFRAVAVYDVSQTGGEPLPELAEELPGDVAQYETFMDALRAVSPFPIDFETLPEGNDGYCNMGERRIAIRSGMGETQTVSAVIHEITHAKLHDRAVDADSGGETPARDRRTEEIEAESVSYAVCQYYNIETGANSFGYLADWSKSKELKELSASLDIVRKTAAELIEGIDENFRALAVERAETHTAVDLPLDAPVTGVEPQAAQPEPVELTVMAHTVDNEFHFYGADAELVAGKLGLPTENRRGTVRGVPYDVLLSVPKEQMDGYSGRLLEYNISTAVDGVPKGMTDAEKYSISYGFFGDGITVTNTAEERDGAPVAIARIMPDRTVRYYDPDIPDDIKRGIEQTAAELDDPALRPLRDAAYTENAKKEFVDMYYDLPVEFDDSYDGNGERLGLELSAEIAQENVIHHWDYSEDGKWEYFGNRSVMTGEWTGSAAEPSPFELHSYYNAKQQEESDYTQNTPGREDIPPNDRDLVARIQGYVQSVGKVTDVTDNEIYQAVLNRREHEQGVFWDTYRSIGDAILNERTLAEVRSQHEEATPIDIASLREKLFVLSAMPDMDAKHTCATEILIEALCQNAELLAFANAGGDWQSGGGRYAVFDGGYYEALVDALRDELAELLVDKTHANRLENAVKGNVNQRLSDIAYDRATLDEYAEIAKSGRLEVYLTPYPENSENTGVRVHLTELLPDGGKYDYGAIFGYDPDDTRDHAISNYLSAKNFNVLRESVFGKPETGVTLTYRETEPVGSTVLRRLLFNDMNFNREQKRTRVEVLPPMGKYSVYAQHLSGVIGDDTTIHIGTDSGYLLPLNVDRTNFEKRYFESFIDRMFERAGAQLDAQLANPEKFAMYQQAVITGRIDEAEAHNAVYRTFKAEKDGERRAEIAEQQAAAAKEAKRRHTAEITANAETLASGGRFEVGASRYSGKNNLLELFALYGIDVPLATKGWLNKKLTRLEFSAHGGLSYSSYRNKNSKSQMSDTAYTKLKELRTAIQLTPVAVKLAEKGIINNDAAELPPIETEMPEALPTLTPDDKEFWRGHIADLLAANGGKTELDDLELPPFDHYGGLGKFHEVFGEQRYKHEFAHIVAKENAKRTGEPWTVFDFCEGGDYRPDILRTPTAMLFSEADKFIRGYEPKVRAINMGGGYDKLDVTTYIRRGDNEVYPITDRYDIGESRKISGLYNTLKAETDYYYAHPEIFGWKTTDENFAGDKALAYADIAILKETLVREYPYAEIEKVTRYADGDKLDQRVFNEGEILSIAEADSKIKTEEKAIRDNKVKKYGSPGDGDEELSIAIHFMLPGENEQSVFRMSYLLGDFNGEQSGLLKHFELGGSYINFCIRNGDYGNVNTVLGGKTAADATRLAAEYSAVHEALRDGMLGTGEETAPERIADTTALLPDPTVTPSERSEYGYTADELLPLSRERALELYDADNPVYLLYPDNREAMAFDRGEIEKFDGLFGIERSDWEKIREAGDNGKKREGELLAGEKNMFGIYQIKDTEELRDMRFAPTSDIKTRGLTVNRDNYNLVCVGALNSRDTQTTPDRIYSDFNEGYTFEGSLRPDDYSGRSVSVSDVIVLNWSGHIRSHYVDDFGFAELDNFTGRETEKTADRAEDVSAENGTLKKAKPGLLERLDEMKRQKTDVSRTEYEGKTVLAGAPAR
jgi:hypothetical protein